VIQVCRKGEYEKDGITILSSTRQPTKFYLRGDYCLFTHLIMSRTVPQRGGSERLCTLKFKGWVIDVVALLLFDDSPRQRYIGFNADETKRANTESSLTEEKSPYYLIGYNADETGRLKDKGFGKHQAQIEALMQPFFSRPKESAPLSLAQRTLDAKRSKDLLRESRTCTQFKIHDPCGICEAARGNQVEPQSKSASAIAVTLC
jgi:hypothetical protein